MNCYCGKTALRNSELCKEHWTEQRYKERAYLDNTDRDNLGILKWARDMLPEYLPQATPWFHIEMLMLLFALFDPFYKNRYERQLNIISFRGSSKSTLINMLFTEYLLCNIGRTMKILGVNGTIIEVVIDEKFIVICSETGGSAEEFVVRLRDELTTNSNLKFFYGGTIEDALDDTTGQWTRRAFKYNGCFVMGAGVGQQIRGKIKGAYRATLLFADDIYSENNTITDDGRAKVKKWFDRAVINSIDDLRGKTVVVGTILHEDTVLIENKKSKNWKTVEYQVMPLEKFKKFVAEHLQVAHQQGSCKLPFEDLGLDEFQLKSKQREYFTKVQEGYNWELAWKERIDLYFLALKYQDATQKNSLGSLYQEYFHQPITDENKRIKEEYFRHMNEYKIFREYGYTWFKCDLFSEPYVINVELAIDVGTGTADGDDSVIVVGGILSNGYRVVLKTVYGKYDLRDIRADNGLLNLGRVIEDRSLLKDIGVLDEALRLTKEYGAKMIKVGYAGSEKNNVNLMRQLCYANGFNEVMVLGRQQASNEGDKRERILNRIAPFYQTYSVIHVKGLTKLESQLQFLMGSKEDDVADACFAKGTLIKTIKGDIPIEQIKVGNKILTPIGFKKVVSVLNRKAKTINKFGFIVTPNHKFYNNNSFSSIDAIENPLYFSKSNIKDLLLWRYKLSKYQILQTNQEKSYLMGWSSGEQGRANIIFLSLIPLNGGLLKDFMSTFGSMLMGCKFHLVIIFTTKIIMHLITILLTSILWKLKNIWNTIEGIAIKKMKFFLKSILQKFGSKHQSGMGVKKELSGIKNIIKSLRKISIKNIFMNIFVLNVNENIKIQEKKANTVVPIADTKQEKYLISVLFALLIKQYKERINRLFAEVVQQNFVGKEETVYNIEVEQAGCYYANNILVSNCEVLFYNMQKPPEVDPQILNPQKEQIRWKKNRFAPLSNGGWDWRTN
jgi:hypothetical protein